MRLVIGGDGELAQSRELAEQLGVAAEVEFLGWISGPEKRYAMLHADAFVLPSYNEGLPMSILEAMAFSLPVSRPCKTRNLLFLNDFRVNSDGRIS